MLLSSCIEPAYVRESLTHAEALIDEHPDSALTTLKSINPESVSSRHSRALYALLMTRALDKNYFTLDSDTLITRAVDYFEGSADRLHQMQSRYYLGIIKINTEAYAEALLSLSKAHEIARELDDNFWIAMTARSIAEIYHSNFNTADELKYAEISLDYFKKTGKTDFIDYAIYDLASAYHNNESYTTAIEISKQLLDSAIKHNDILLKQKTSFLLGLSHLAINDYGKSYNYFKVQFASPDVTTSDSVYFASAALRTGHIEEAKEIIKQLANSSLISKNHKDWINYQLYMSLDSIRKALAMMSEMNSNTNKVLKDLRKQNLTGRLLEHNRHTSELMQSNLHAAHATLWCVALGSILIIFICISVAIRHHRRQQSEIDRQISLVQNLRQIVKEKENLTTDNNRPLPEFFIQYFKELDELCKNFYENDSTKTRKKLSESIGTLINSYSIDSTKVKELENYANLIYDNIMNQLASDFPTLKKADKLMFLYSLLGFSNISISMLLKEDSMSKIYNRRKRLKAKFKDFEGENKPKYLKAIS